MRTITEMEEGDVRIPLSARARMVAPEKNEEVSHGLLGWMESMVEYLLGCAVEGRLELVDGPGAADVAVYKGEGELVCLREPECMAVQLDFAPFVEVSAIYVVRGMKREDDISGSSR